MIDLPNFEDYGAIPEELHVLLRLILEGRVAQLAWSAVLTDGDVYSAFPILERAEPHAVLGALMALQRDVMRVQLGSRVRYVEAQDD